MVQPITKIVLLVENDFPTGSDENITKFPGSFGEPYETTASLLDY